MHWDVNFIEMNDKKGISMSWEISKERIRNVGDGCLLILENKTVKNVIHRVTDWIIIYVSLYG